MRLRKRAAWGFVALASGWGPSLTSAAFVDGVETFDGTTLDPATWQPYTEPVGAITQDDRLILSRDLSGRVDYVTRDVAVGIGQGVRVDFEILDPEECKRRHPLKRKLMSPISALSIPTSNTSRF